MDESAGSSGGRAKRQKVDKTGLLINTNFPFEYFNVYIMVLFFLCIIRSIRSITTVEKLERK